MYLCFLPPPVLQNLQLKSLYDLLITSLEELQALQDNGTVVFQPGDKNAGFVVMNRQDYISEGYRQLNETY